MSALQIALFRRLPREDPEHQLTMAREDQHLERTLRQRADDAQNCEGVPQHDREPHHAFGGGQVGRSRRELLARRDPDHARFVELVCRNHITAHERFVAHGRRHPLALLSSETSVSCALIHRRRRCNSQLGSRRQRQARPSIGLIRRSLKRVCNRTQNRECVDRIVHAAGAVGADEHEVVDGIRQLLRKHVRHHRLFVLLDAAASIAIAE